MAKLKRYSTNRIFKYLFILLITIIPIGIINSLFKFYNDIFHSDLLRDFITVDFLNSLLFFLSAFFIAGFVYTINVCFPDDEIKKYQVKDIITFFLEFSFVYIFMIIFSIEILSSSLMYQKDNLALKDKHLKLLDKNNNAEVK